MRRQTAKRQREKATKRENIALIRSFIDNSEFGSDYEVWAPYIYRGLVGFVDLVVRRKKRTFLLEFLTGVEEMERTVKSIKLKTKIFKEKRGTTQSINAHMVLEDKKANREAVIQNGALLEHQPFGILFFDGERTVSYSGTKERVPRLFQTRGVELEKDALEYLIGEPNHEEIERAVLNLEDPPETIDRKFVERVKRYIQVKGVPSEGTSSLVLKRSREPKKEKRTSNVYVGERPKG